MLRLLGPIDLVVGDRSLELGGPRQQVVLAMLGLNANRVTPIDQLVDAVWGETPPPTARGQIQVCISRLRKLLATAGCPQAIRTRTSGYVLELAADQLDVLAFTAQLSEAMGMAEAGRTADAATALGAALALWRGPALLGLDSDLVRRRATVLDERRMVGVEERVRLDLELGRHAELTYELPLLIKEHPLRERLYGSLMLALYRSGRQAEALDVFRRARATLVEEVGVEPGPELQDLERAILTRDVALVPAVEENRSPPAARPSAAQAQGSTAPPAAPSAEAEAASARYTPPVPRQLPATIADFTGRESEISAITRMILAQDEHGTAQRAVPIVAIFGRGGAGKSSLAVRVAHELNDHFTDGVLYAALQQPSTPERTGAQVARFLRALGAPGTALPDDLGERSELYRTWLAGRRVLVVLDDVADESQLLPLLPGDAGCAMIVTSRRRLSGLPGAHHVPVKALGAADSLDLLARMIGAERVSAQADAAAELGELCEGLPLALRIAGARLASRTHWPITRLIERLRDEGRRLDELEHRGWELRSSLRLTYDSLEPRAQRLFRLLAIVDAVDLPSWIAAAVLDTDLMTAEDLLEDLVEAHVLDTVEYPGVAGTHYRFHDLVRPYARELLVGAESTDEQVEALSRVLGGWLELVDVAHRKEYGGDYTTIHGDAPRWRIPGAEPPDLVGNQSEWWDGERLALVAAVRQAAKARLDEYCWDLSLACVTLFEAKGYFDDWREVVEVAKDAAERAGNRIGVAAMLYSLGTLYMFQSRLMAAGECFDAAGAMFAAAGHQHGRALVLRNAAHVDRLLGDSEAMMAKYDRALAMLRQVGDRIGAVHVMRSQAVHWISAGELDTARSLLEGGLAVCREVGCLRVEAQILHSLAELHERTGDLDLARQELHRVLRIVRDTGDRVGEAHALYGLGVVRHKEGRLDSAVTTLVHALELARRTGERLVEAKACYSLGAIELVRGDAPSAVTYLTDARGQFEELGAVVWTAKTLLLLADAHGEEVIRPDERPSTAPSAVAETSHLRDAVRLLSATGSPEAQRILRELTGSGSVPPAHDDDRGR